MARTCSILQEASDWPKYPHNQAMSLDVWQYIDPSLPTERALPSSPLEPPVPSQISLTPDGTELKNVNFDLHLKAYAVQYMMYKDKREQVEKIREQVASVHTYVHPGPYSTSAFQGGRGGVRVPAQIT